MNGTIRPASSASYASWKFFVAAGGVNTPSWASAKASCWARLATWTRGTPSFSLMARFVSAPTVRTVFSGSGLYRAKEVAKGPQSTILYTFSLKNYLARSIPDALSSV